MLRFKIFFFNKSGQPRDFGKIIDENRKNFPALPREKRSLRRHVLCDLSSKLFTEPAQRSFRSTLKNNFESVFFYRIVSFFFDIRYDHVCHPNFLWHLLRENNCFFIFLLSHTIAFYLLQAPKSRNSKIGSKPYLTATTVLS